MFFQTSAPIDPSDTDAENDLYMRLNGNVTFLAGPPGKGGKFAVEDDGSSFDFSTSERVDPADTDSQYDVYRRVGGSYVFVSQGGTCPRKSCRAELDSGVASGGRGFSTATSSSSLRTPTRATTSTSPRTAPSR